MARLNGSTRSWNSIFGCTSTTNRTIGLTSFPWPSLCTTTRRTLRPWSPLSLLTRVFIPNRSVSQTCCVGYCSPGCYRSQGAPSVHSRPSISCRQTIQGPLCVTTPPDPPIQSRGHCLARCTEHLNHSPLKEARPSLPGVLPDCGEGVVACIPTWAVPSFVAHSSCVPCVLLQPTSPSEIPNRAVDPPPPVELDDADKWEVHRILDSRIDRRRKGSGLLYLVEWKGFDNTPDETSWEPPEHLANASDVVQAFHRAYPDKPAP